MREEPQIVINGRVLTEGQAMAVRVALGMFISNIIDNEGPSFGDIGLLYVDRLREVQDIIATPPAAARVPLQICDSCTHHMACAMSGDCDHARRVEDAGR